VIEYFVMAFFVAQPLAAKAAPAAPAATPASAVGLQAGPVAPTTFKNPITIAATKFQIIDKRKEAIWTENVRAQRGEADLRCDRLVATYRGQQEITRIQCLGRVEVREKDLFVKGDRADFDNVTGVLEVTGSPEARKGNTVLKGSKVRFTLGTDLLEVTDSFTVFPSAGAGPVKLPGPRPGAKAP